MIELLTIDMAHPHYVAERQLRYEVLRKPLGMPKGSEENPRESDCIHVVALQEGQVVGCVLGLNRGQGMAKLLQMAVSPEVQGQGVGALLVRHLEAELKARGFHSVIMHARESARGFYAKLGYAVEGLPFTEVGIAHITMKRTL